MGHGCGSGACGRADAEMGRLYVGVRQFGAEDGRQQLCFTGESRPQRGSKLVVEGEKGLEFAEVVEERPVVIKSCQTKGARRFVRFATSEDESVLGRKLAREREAFHYCMEKSRERNLEMKLVRAEFDWDLRRVQITYTAEARVDFRELVKDLARGLGCRIEMRQIGVRDGTRLTGGLGPCGLSLCCSTFLHDFHPVTIKMAKNQNLSLNPSKISGQCGRLMCCLAYENDVYVDRKKGGGAARNAPPEPEDDAPEA